MHNLCRRPAVWQNLRKVTAVKIILQKNIMTAKQNRHAMMTVAHPVLHAIPL